MIQTRMYHFIILYTHKWKKGVSRLPLSVIKFNSLRYKAGAFSFNILAGGIASCAQLCLFHIFIFP